MAPGSPVGKVIEKKYRLDKQIGQGGMSTVYRGIQLAVDRPVAIKLLHPNFAGHDKLQARFEVEAKAIARLNHPNCITLFDFGYSEELNAFYTIVEFIDGIPLESLIPQRTPVARVVELIRQIASGLGHAHHHGILHRDLKPENIMLAQMPDGSETAKVLDFGIAQIMNPGSDGDDDFEIDRLTRVGEVFGTPAYMSPEQTQSTHDLAPTTDIYSLGVIFYELLEGRLPFYAELPIDILRMHTTEPPPPITRSDVPASVQAVVMQMLAKDPAQRPPTSAKVIELLDAIPADELSKKTAPIRAAGSARSSDPTLISAPEDRAPTSPSHQDPHLHPTLDDLPTGEQSIVIDLNDIVPDELIDDGITARNFPTRLSDPDGDRAIELQEAPDQHAPKGTLYTPPDDDLMYIGMRQSRQTRNRLFIFFVLLICASLAIALFVLSNDDESSQHLDQTAGSASTSTPKPQPGTPSERTSRRNQKQREIREVRVGDDSQSTPGPKRSPHSDLVEPDHPPPPPPTRPATTPQAPEKDSTKSRKKPQTITPLPPKRQPAPTQTDQTTDEEPRRPARLGL